MNVRSMLDFWPMRYAAQLVESAMNMDRIPMSLIGGALTLFGVLLLGATLRNSSKIYVREWRLERLTETIHGVRL